MPEAVSSNSTPAHSGQPSSSIDRAMLHDTILEGEALTVMLGALLDQQSSLPSDISFGVCNLMRSVFATLHDIHRSVPTETVDALPSLQKNRVHEKAVYAVLSNSLRSRIQGMTAAIWRECFPDGDETTAQNIQFVSRIAQQYTAAIMQQLSDEDDALEAGSYLPWVEMKIRSEVAKDAGILFSDVEYVKSLLIGHVDKLSLKAHSTIKRAAS